MAGTAVIHNAPMESIIKTFKDNEFDIVYTMAVLVHIHPDSEWTFYEIVRITGNLLLTIEDEFAVTQRHFARKYKTIFEKLGMAEIYHTNCEGVPGLGNKYFARLFKKVHT